MAKELSKTLEKKLQSRIWFFSLVDELNDIDNIIEKLKSCSACNVFVIKHDKDKVKQDDGTTIPKRNHHHFALRFENPMELKTIANIFGFGVDEYHYIQKSKNWKGSLRYMLHLDNKDKHLYDIKEIQVLRGSKDDYFNVAIGKAQVVTSDSDLFPDFANFKKVPYKQQYIDVYDTIDEPKRRNILLNELNKSFQNYMDRRKFEMDKKFVKVLVIEGKTGTGKSTFAEQLCYSSNLTFCRSSSANDTMQDYTDEDVMILDDLRDTTFEFADLLKLLDNYFPSSIKSRFKNKQFLGDMIIITTSVPLSEWYLKTKKDEPFTEDRNQLFRRITGYATCEKIGNSLFAKVLVPTTDEIKSNNGNSALDCNGFPITNRVQLTPVLDLTPKQYQDVKDMWSSLGISFDDVMEQISINDITFEDDKK